VRSKECPGDEYVRGRLSFKRTPHSEEHRQKISQANRGKPAHNRGVHATPETKQKMSDSAKRRIQRDGLPIGSFKKKIMIDSEE
jgi:hypothetical protein